MNDQDFMNTLSVAELALLRKIEAREEAKAAAAAADAKWQAEIAEAAEKLRRAFA